jgi:Fe-S cluster assembly protein SufD
MAGLFFARGRQRVDNQTFLDHAFPHGESNELYKGIVMDRAVSSFNGKVLVRPDAQKTNAFQQNDNLIIGTKAEANAKPQLEIFADDVKCSHGATIGQMDEGPLFYLMARGIDKGTALGMLQRGFLLEVLETIKSEAVRSYVEQLLMSKFNES